MPSSRGNCSALFCVATFALGRSEIPSSRDSILMQLQAWHVHTADTHSTKVECNEYMTSTGCSWTTQWSCPEQPIGLNGAASNDGTVGYRCCCEEQMWETSASPEANTLITEDDDDEEPIYRLNFAGSCEDEDMLTIRDLDECLAAASALTGFASVMFPSDQPSGGYPIADATHPGGCAMHLLEVSKSNEEKRVRFYPNANGDCGSNTFLCFCKEMPETKVPTPAPSPASDTERSIGCMTCKPGDLCFKDVEWTMVHGFRVQPDWYSSGEIDENSCFEDVQMFLYQRQQNDRSHWDGMLEHPIPAPCWRKQNDNYIDHDLLYCR